MALRLLLAGSVSLALIQLPARADDKGFKDEKAKASYGAGLYFGNMLKRSNLDLDLDVLVGAMKDVLAGRELKLTDQQGNEALRAYQQSAMLKLAEKNKKEGEAFLAENKKKEGVKVEEIKLPNGATAELQYKIIKEGSGETPKPSDTVLVNYRGTLIDGKEFDSSAKHGGQPAKFGVMHVVKGWSEALQKMKVGSKWDLYIPSSLAYGDRPSMGIEPGSTLLFEVELVGIEAPKAAPAPQPLTSDIIKVPSAEELKKGAKIEVIKPEEAARMAAEAHTNSASASASRQ